LSELLPEAEWDRLPFTSPPILSELTDVQIKGILEGQEAPCHSQSVKRAVKLMAEATGHYSEHSNQRGFILNKIESRKEMKEFKSKKYFPGIQN